MKKPKKKKYIQLTFTDFEETSVLAEQIKEEFLKKRRPI